MNEPKRPLGRPPKSAEDRVIRLVICLTPAESARLDAVPGKSRSDRIRTLMTNWETGWSYIVECRRQGQ